MRAHVQVDVRFQAVLPVEVHAPGDDTTLNVLLVALVKPLADAVSV
jgi:hypothetical protein